MKWPRWSSFKTNWLRDAAAKHSEEVKAAEENAAEAQRLKLPKSSEPASNAPTVFVIPTEVEKLPTRKDITSERRLW